MKEGDRIVDDEKDLENIFNKFFKEKIEKIKDGIETTQEDDPIGKMHELVAGKDLFFEMRPVSLEQTTKALKSLKSKKSSGNSSVPKVVIKGAAEVLALPLQRVINTSIRDGIYPRAFKNVTGIPVFKKGSRQDKA